MDDDQPTPEQQAEEEAAKARASAQGAAADLARMGIDPRSLGLDSADADQQHAPRRTDAPPTEGVDAPNVYQLRPESSSLPASGSSRAWAAAPPPLAGPGDAAPPSADNFRTEFLAGAQAPGQPAPELNRLARAITFGMVTPDAADAADREREMVARVRARQTEQRIVAVISGQGGVGATTVALGVGFVLAALRDDSTTVISMRPGAPSISHALTGRVAPSVRELSRAESESAALEVTDGLAVVDASTIAAPVRRSEVPGLIDRVSESSTFALFDIGNDPSEASQALLSRADQVVIVSGTGIDAVASARIAAMRAAEVDPYLLERAVHVVVCRRDTAMKQVVKAMHDAMPEGGRIVALPPEAPLADGHAFDPSAVGSATRLGLIDIAGLVALGAVAHATRW